jgi:hypothetical protein
VRIDILLLPPFVHVMVRIIHVDHDAVLALLLVPHEIEEVLSDRVLPHARATLAELYLAEEDDLCGQHASRDDAARGGLRVPAERVEPSEHRLT